MTFGVLARKRGVAVGLVAAAVLLAASSLAGAQGGDSNQIHACVVTSSGSVRIVGANERCRQGETALDWSRGADLSAITADDLALDSVVGGEGGDVKDESISAFDLGADSVSTSEIDDNSVGAIDLADDAVIGRAIAGDASLVNIKLGTIRGEHDDTSGMVTGDIALGTISGQGDNDDSVEPSADNTSVTGNLGVQTVGRRNLVDGAVDGTKLSASLLGELVTEAELTALLQTMKNDEHGATAPKAPNDGDGFLHWNHIEGMPNDIADGDDDDGGSRVQQLENDLDGDSTDVTPNDSNDLVSFNEVKDLTSGADGRITGTYIKDGTITAEDLDDGSVTSDKIVDGSIGYADLAGAYGTTDRDGDGLLDQIIIGAVTSDKIADGSVQGRDLAAGAVGVTNLASDVITRFEAIEARVTNLASAPAAPLDTDRVHISRLTGTGAVDDISVDPPSIDPETRGIITIPLAGLQVGDLVTLSPPSDLDDDLLFVGHEPKAGEIAVYLYNNTANAIDDDLKTWRVQHIDLTP